MPPEIPPPPSSSIRATHQTQLLHRLTIEALGVGSESGSGRSNPSAGSCGIRPPCGIPLPSWLGLEEYEAALGRVLVNAIVVKPKSPFAFYFSSLR